MGEIARRVTAMEAPRVAVQRPVFGVPVDEQSPGAGGWVAARPAARAVRYIGPQDAAAAGLRGLVGARPVRAVGGLLTGGSVAWAVVSLIPDGLLFYVPVTGLGVVGAALLAGRRWATRRDARVDQVLGDVLAAERRAELEHATRERRPVRVEVEVDEVVVDAEVVGGLVALPARAAVEVPAVVRRRVVA